MMTFMGEPMSMWAELHRRVMASGLDSVQTYRLVQELADLHGKVAFYEQRIKEMRNIMERK